MKRIVYVCWVMALFATSCSNFEDADLTDRATFMHFYGSSASYRGTVAEPDSDGGYILAGVVLHGDGRQNAVIFKTNSRGFVVHQAEMENTVINSIMVRDGGYILCGDGIELNPTETRITELVNTQAKIVFMDTDLTVQETHITRQSIGSGETKVEVDFHGSAISADKDNFLYVLGSMKRPGENERSYITAYSPAFDSLWTQTYGLLDRDYVNCKSLFLTNDSRLVWASKTFRQQQNLSREYVSVSFVEPNSTFRSNSLFGENDPRNHTAEDIQASAVGFGIAGTYSEPDGSSANMYFMRVDATGNVIAGSERYFDGLSELTFDSRDQSSSEDQGLAVTATRHGYVLAGRITTTPTLGNGGTDIALIKLGPLGDFISSKLIGGTGDETISSIRETPDGGLVLCGTNTINGLSSILLIKTDENGELKD